VNAVVEMPTHTANPLVNAERVEVDSTGAVDSTETPTPFLQKRRPRLHPTPLLAQNRMMRATKFDGRYTPNLGF
jgi:hypothetical protein